MTRLAIQSHTLRALEEPLPETVRRVATAGYDGIEFAGRLTETDPDRIAAALHDTGIEPVAVHVDRTELVAEFDDVVRRCERIGCSRVVVPHRGPVEFLTGHSTVRLAERLDGLGVRLAEHDIDLLFHNTAYSLRPTFRRPGVGSVLSIGPLPNLLGGHATAVYDRLRPESSPADTAFGRLVAGTETIRFELDIGWTAVAGYDPDAVADLLDGRLDVVHLTGGADVGVVVRLARRTDAEWVVVENDDPDDPRETIRHGPETVAPRIADGS